MLRNFLILPLLSLNLMAMEKDDAPLYDDNIFRMTSLQEQQRYIQTLSEDQQMALYDRLCDVQISLANNQIPSLEQEISLLEKQVRNNHKDTEGLKSQAHEQKASLTGFLTKQSKLFAEDLPSFKPNITPNQIQEFENFFFERLQEYAKDCMARYSEKDKFFTSLVKALAQKVEVPESEIISNKAMRQAELVTTYFTAFNNSQQKIQHAESALNSMLTQLSKKQDQLRSFQSEANTDTEKKTKIQALLTFIDNLYDNT